MALGNSDDSGRTARFLFVKPLRSAHDTVQPHPINDYSSDIPRRGA